MDFQEQSTLEGDLAVGARLAAAHWLDAARGHHTPLGFDELGRRILVECTYCTRVQNRSNDWAHLPLALRPTPHAVSHGICPACLDLHHPEVMVDQLLGPFG